MRELAHARLFRQAKWLRLQLLASITEFARGIRIDTDRLEELAADFDPNNPAELREAMTSGALIPPKSDEQLAALARLETTLALIEGWVDVVTAEATKRLPSSAAIAETVRRRRASGGPAESAFATLVGLELRPRRLREAAAMWQAVSDAVGPEQRDALWSHPDAMPTGEDIDDPAALIARITGAATEPDDIDLAIEELLGDDSGERPTENPRPGLARRRYQRDQREHLVQEITTVQMITTMNESTIDAIAIQVTTRPPAPRRLVTTPRPIGYTTP